MRTDPWNRPADYEEEKWWWIFKNPIGFVLLATFIIGIVIIIWHIAKPLPKDSNGVPIIEASKAPLKIKPENPGGEIIQHQDKMVYQNLVKKKGKNENEENQIERIILPPSVGSMIETSSQVAAEEIEMEKTINQAIESTIQKQTAPVSDLEKIKQTGKFKIQLASLKSATKAKAEWERISKAHKDILGPLSPSYSNVDLGEKGHYTRLRIEGFETKAKAKKMCDLLKSKKVGCIVVK